MPAQDTELRLQHWMNGSTQAERMVAAILRIEGYKEISPQAPVGGPDQRADIICNKGGYRYVVAVYFPSTGASFQEVKTKFDHDLEGAIQRQPSHRAFAFFSNQRLTLSQRQSLKQSATNNGIESEIYDVERIRAALDSPMGYGIRVTYLGIPMTDAEQISYFSDRELSANAAIVKNTEVLNEVRSAIFQLQRHNQAIGQTVSVMAQNSGIETITPPLRSFDPLLTGEISASFLAYKPTLNLNVDLVSMIHRLVCFDLPTRLIGNLRTENVTLSNYSNETTVAIPDHHEVADLLREACTEWNDSANSAIDEDQKVSAITKLHHEILRIHPFSDGNGRTSRALLMQQCLDLFGRVNMSMLNRGPEYRIALQQADEGNMNKLNELIVPLIKDT